MPLPSSAPPWPCWPTRAASMSPGMRMPLRHCCADCRSGSDARTLCMRHRLIFNNITDSINEPKLSAADHCRFTITRFAQCFRVFLPCAYHVIAMCAALFLPCAYHVIAVCAAQTFEVMSCCSTSLGVADSDQCSTHVSLNPPFVQ